MSLSFISYENEKVEQHIRYKIQKSIVLRFWVESGVILLYVKSSRWVKSLTLKKKMW